MGKKEDEEFLNLVQFSNLVFYCFRVLNVLSFTHKSIISQCNRCPLSRLACG